MTLLKIVRYDVALAQGVVFAGGSVVVHTSSRGGGDQEITFRCLADLERYYTDCDIEVVTTEQHTVLVG